MDQSWSSRSSRCLEASDVLVIRFFRDGDASDIDNANDNGDDWRLAVVDGDTIEFDDRVARRGVFVVKANAIGIATTIEATTMLGSSSNGTDGDDNRRNFIMMMFVYACVGSSSSSSNSSSSSIPLECFALEFQGR
jgi:hypothetical protein